MGRQGYVVRRLLRPRQRLCDHRRGDGKKEVKTILKAQDATGLAYLNGALYVVDINKIMRYDNPEANLDKMPEPKVVYDDMPSYAAHGWKYIAVDKDGWFYIPLGPPFNIGLLDQRVADPPCRSWRSAMPSLVALGVGNSVGGDVDPRSGKYWSTENARDWLGDDLAKDKLNMIRRWASTSAIRIAIRVDIPDPKFAGGHKCSEFTPPVVKLGDHVAPLGMKFYTGSMFPAEYKNNILIAEHGPWNRHQYQGARIVRVIVGPDGQEPEDRGVRVGMDRGQAELSGRPADIVQAKDGSILIADDWAGATTHQLRQGAGDEVRTGLAVPARCGVLHVAPQNWVRSKGRASLRPPDRGNAPRHSSGRGAQHPGHGPSMICRNVRS